ncbi:8129_t:CDS:2, partial [Gigaspora margarita]
PYEYDYNNAEVDKSFRLHDQPKRHSSYCPYKAKTILHINVFNIYLPNIFKLIILGFKEAPNYDSESDSSEDENKKTRDNTIEECRHQLHQLMNVQPPTSNEHTTLPSTKNLSPNNMFKELIFGSAQRLQEFTNELDFYLEGGHQ